MNRTVRRTLRASAVLALAFSGLAAPAQAGFIGINISGTLYNIDGSGAGTVLASSGASGANAMARDSAGNIIVNGGGNPTRFYDIDPLSGAGTLAGTVPTAFSVRGLAYDSADQLFAVVDGGTTSAPDRLYTIDLGTSSRTLIGTNLGFTNIQGLAFNGTTMYGWSISAGLLTVDLATGLATDVNGAVGTGGAAIQALAFDDSGRLFGIQDGLYEIDVVTGGVSFIGSGGYSDLRGLEFVADTVSVPEPGMLALFGLGLFGLGIARRRRAA